MSARFLDTAIVRLRKSLSRPDGSSVQGWRLLYAAQALAQGKRHPEYRGPGAMRRLVDDIKEYVPEMRSVA